MPKPSDPSTSYPTATYGDSTVWRGGWIRKRAQHDSTVWGGPARRELGMQAAGRRWRVGGCDSTEQSQADVSWGLVVTMG